MKRNNTLKYELKRSVTAIAVFSVVFSTLVISIFFGRQLWKQLRSEQVFYTNYTASRIDYWFQEHLVKLLFISQFSDLVNETGSYQQRILDSTVESYSAFTDVFIVDAGGKVVAGQNRLFDPEHLYETLAFNLDVVIRNGEEFLGVPLRVRQINELQMPVAYPLRDGSGKINGALCANLNLNYLEFIVNTIEYGRTGFGYVISPQNRVIMHNSSLPVEEPEPDHNIFLELVGSPKQFYHCTGLTGQRVMTTYQRLETVNWFLVINQPLADIFGYLYKVILLVVGSAIIALLLGLELALRYSRKIDDPLHTLTQAASQIAAGDLNTRIELKSDNELQDLAQAFNYTTGQLRKLFEGLDLRCRFESVLGKITRKIINYRIDLSEELISEMLGEVADFLGASNASLLFYNESSGMFTCRNKWHRNGVNESSFTALQYLDFRIYPNVRLLLTHGKLFELDVDDSDRTVGDVFEGTELPSEIKSLVLRDTPLYRDLLAEHYRHVIVMPVIEGNRYIGLFGFLFDKLAKDLSLPDRESLVTLNNILVSSVLFVQKGMHFNEEHERLKATLYGIGDAVIATDDAGVITMINPIACRMTGWSEEEAIGTQFAKVFKISDIGNRKPIELDLVAKLRTDQTYCMEEKTLLHNRNGFECYISDSAARINNVYGQMVGAVIVFRDETQNYFREKEQLKLQRLEAVSLLAAGIAHDFNNLLTTILGNISLAVQMLPPQSEVAQILHSAEISTEKGRDITKQLLVYAKGGTPDKKISSIVKLTDETLKFLMQGSKITIKKDIPPSTWKIKMVPGVYNQIISNIIINARQAMAQDGLLELKAENITLDNGSPLPLSQGNYVMLTIADNGEGIDPAILPKIFDPYVTTKNTGTGLGLTSTFALLQKHNGYITVESAPGKGTIVKLYFQASDEIAFAEDETSGYDKKNGRRVLIFESESSLQKLLHKVLNVKDINVDLSASLVETLELFKAALEEKDAYDCIILDIDILNREYIRAVVNEIRAMNHNVLLILACEFVSPSVIADLKDIGFDEVIVKPFQVSDLRKLVLSRLHV